MRNKTNYNNYQREYQRDYQANKYHKWREFMLTYLGNKCVMCGSTEDLQVDHIDASLKTANFSAMHSYSKERQMKELENAQLLCKSCHQTKTELNKEAPHTFSDNDGVHGTGYMYTQKKCKCNRCAVWQKAYKRKLVQYNEKISDEIFTQLSKSIQRKSDDIKHGTRAGYLKEGRLGLERCELCKAANTEYTRQLKKKE